MSPKTVEWLALSPDKTSRAVTVATGTKSGAVGKQMKVPVRFEDMRANLNFFILEKVPFDIAIGRQITKRLEKSFGLP